MTVLEYLRENNLNIAAPCGGNGTCKKCMVSVDGGAPLLACRTEYVSGMDIKVLSSSDDIAILGTDGIEKAEDRPDSGRYGIAVDIGTTTIAGVICDRGSGKILAEDSCINSNVSFGADVISRIKAGGEGKGEIMRDNLLGDIRTIVLKLYNKAITGDIDDGSKEKTIDIIALAGNTTMIHTLMGYDLSSLGVYPYKPVFIGLIQGKTGDILNIKTNGIESSQCVIFPGASAFVGGDIIAGLYYLETRKDNERYALIDLGTNGEMAIVTPDTIYAASTAAGPVFEGGEISCGTGAVPGAIDHVRMDDHGNSSYTTIGDIPTVKGICGSGIIDVASVMLETGACNEHGTYTGEEAYTIARYPDRSKVLFTQEDMRKLQLAKAAIAAGFETLCHVAGTPYDDIGRLYLAGGMGYAIDIDSAVSIRLVPPELYGRIYAAGNTVLLGLLRYICSTDPDPVREISGISDRCRVVDLSAQPDFQEAYIAHMDLIPV